MYLKLEWLSSLKAGCVSRQRQRLNKVLVEWQFTGCQDRATASVALRASCHHTNVHVALIRSPEDSHAGCRFGLCKHLEFVPEFSYCVLQCVGL